MAHLDEKHSSVELAFDQHAIVLDADSGPVHPLFEQIFAHLVVGYCELDAHQQLAIHCHCHLVAVGFLVQHDHVAVAVPVAVPVAVVAAVVAAAVAAVVVVVAADFEQSTAPAAILAKNLHSCFFLKMILKGTAIFFSIAKKISLFLLWLSNGQKINKFVDKAINTLLPHHLVRIFLCHFNVLL